MTQKPTVGLNVRIDEDYMAVIDQYSQFLGHKRFTRVSRSDVIRYAIGKLPVPVDAPADLRNAILKIQTTT